MDQEQHKIMASLAEIGAVITGSHIVYTSGKHGRAFVNWAKVLNNLYVLNQTSNQLAQKVLGAWGEWNDAEPITLVGPTHTGDKVASSLGMELASMGVNVRFVYAEEKTEDMFVEGLGVSRKVVLNGRFFPRGQEEFVTGQNCWVVDDILTTGKTLDETALAVTQAGGIVAGYIVACNRSSFTDTYTGLPLISLVQVAMDQWDPVDCLACKEGLPINQEINKHGRDFLQEFGDDPSNWPANQHIWKGA